MLTATERHALEEVVEAVVDELHGQGQLSKDFHKGPSDGPYGSMDWYATIAHVVLRLYDKGFRVERS